MSKHTQEQQEPGFQTTTATELLAEIHDATTVLDKVLTWATMSDSLRAMVTDQVNRLEAISAKATGQTS